MSNICETHYNDVRKDTIASQITSLTIVYPTVYSDADQSKHQSSASLAFVRGKFTGDRWIPRTNGQLRGKGFHLMTSSCALSMMITGLIDDESVLVQVMVWFPQAASHYLRQCRPRSMSPYGVTRPHRFNVAHPQMYADRSHYIIYLWLWIDQCSDILPNFFHCLWSTWTLKKVGNWITRIHKKW